MPSRPTKSDFDPPSPCLHHCGFRDGCCRNCFRTTEEVLQWKTLGPLEKQKIMELAAKRRLAVGK